MISLDLLPMTPTQFFRCLAEPTRLTTLLLLHARGELCVCDLTDALQQSQPKMSRHLAELRQHQLLASRKFGKWVFYRLNPDLPDWARQIIQTTLASQQEEVNVLLAKLPSAQQISQRCC